jgi:hypothetical protein
MADRAVLLPSDPELVQLLRSMELDREALIEVVRFADRERTLCTSNDLRGFDLITGQRQGCSRASGRILRQELNQRRDRQSGRHSQSPPRSARYSVQLRRERGESSRRPDEQGREG